MENLIDYLDGKRAMNKIDLLPEKYKKIMLMRFLESMTINDISKGIGQSKNLISVKIHRGLQKLRIICDPKIRVR